MSIQSGLRILVLMGAALTNAAATSHAHGHGQYGQGEGSEMIGPGMMAPGMMGRGSGHDGARHDGPGMMGHGMGQDMGPGMTGPGMMGPGMMGQGMGPGSLTALPQDLSVENVRHMLEHHLAWQGNPNLKLGNVEERDEDTIVAEIVTQDGSLVQRHQVDRHTGLMQPAG